MKWEGLRVGSLAAFLVAASSFVAIVGIMPPRAGAATLHAGGSGPGNYTTIQAAIDAAGQGDSIFVHAGTYHEMLTVNKSVSLIGEDVDTTVIEFGQATITIEADSVNFTGFTVRDTFEEGILVMDARYVNITGNRFVDNNGSAILVHGSRDVTVAGNSLSNTLPDNWPLFGISFTLSENSTATGNTVSWQLGSAIELWHAKNITLTGNMLTKTGIFLGGDELQEWNTHNIDQTNTLEGRPIYYWKDTVGGRIPGGAAQVLLANVTMAVVENQSIVNASPAIIMGFSSRNLVSNNTFRAVTSCIRFSASDDNTLVNNTVVEPLPTPWGLTGMAEIMNSKGETLRENRAVNGMIYIWGEELAHWNTHSIDSSNSVNGKPVQYWVNANGVTVPAGAGQVILANCTNMTVQDNEIDNTYSGITLAFSRNNTVASNTVRNSNDGVYLLHSDRNTIESNLFEENGYGIHLYYSNNNTISANTISENWAGIAFWNSYASKVYHNNFIDNTDQIEGPTIWHDWRDSILDNGYPSGGNYWSDYDGVDKCKGPDQNDCSGSDGIGDTSFRNDRYPLMRPYDTASDDTSIMLALGIVAVAIVLLMVTLVIARRRRRKKEAVEPPKQEEEDQKDAGRTSPP